jgi:hypothetical protein
MVGWNHLGGLSLKLPSRLNTPKQIDNTVPTYHGRKRPRSLRGCQCNTRCPSAHGAVIELLMPASSTPKATGRSSAPLRPPVRKRFSAWTALSLNSLPMGSYGRSSFPRSL